ncbi:MAG: hypothetical protein F6J98_08620 [Moorea sp. SIO4G2]|nr:MULTISPECIES: hypothetical protein [Moorena]NEO49672.1 hypothetical protein [Moorena sp. SIO4A3]NEO60487.1 hypothetical protein [Moorena sp. SIO4G2]NEO14043.1 hypothetical protein [Moorena sp. SIO3E8]NEO77218.1 hypothetical protein [Moorena sp. SIO4G3]NEQ00518.1 hypothetical protein [Moorena sp. SIO3F7]
MNDNTWRLALAFGPRYANGHAARTLFTTYFLICIYITYLIHRLYSD